MKRAGLLLLLVGCGGCPSPAPPAPVAPSDETVYQELVVAGCMATSDGGVAGQTSGALDPLMRELGWSL